MTEPVWAELCTCCEPPALRVIRTADRRIDFCEVADKREALRDWIGGMIANARANGASDETVRAEFAESVETFSSLASARVKPPPAPTAFPVAMTFADQLCCVLRPLCEVPNDPTWYAVARAEALEAGRLALETEGVGA
jgi:hypothetical protein